MALKLWGRKRKQKLEKDDEENAISISANKETPLYINDGRGTLWDILSPDGIDIREQTHGYLTDSLAGSRPFRPVYVTRSGWPRKLQTDWISSFTAVGEVDVTVYNEKIPSRQAVHSLQRMMTMLKANYRQEIKRGNIDQIHDLETKISDTDALMEDIALGENDLFHSSVQACIYAENEEMLDQLSAYLEDDLGGSFIHLRTAFERIKEGYLSNVPRGKNELLDTYRNLDRRSLSTIFPFASSELKYKGGIPFAVNQGTGNLVFLNLFADDHNNFNMVCLGESGSGKSATIKTIAGRASGLTNTPVALLDPEGEYKKFTKRLGGIYIRIGVDSPAVINPCAVGITELELDDDDDEVKEIEDGREFFIRDGREFVRYVPLKEKQSEILQFFSILVEGNDGKKLDSYEMNYLEECIVEAFAKAKITGNPQSLYEEGSQIIDGEVIHSRILKPEVTITDIYNQLKEKYGNEPQAQSLIAAIKPWLRGGLRGLFDGQTHFGKGVSTDIDNAKIVTFDISELEEGSILRTLGYHVCLTWIWQKFVKSEQNADLHKIVVADEFWQMVDYEQTVNFAEKMGRRCRKRNTSFIIASQDAKRILENDKAQGVVTNSTIQLILRQNPINMQLMQNAFALSGGEASVVVGETKKGEGILRSQGETVHIRTDLTEYEKVLFESNRAKMKELERSLRAMKEREEALRSGELSSHMIEEEKHLAMKEEQELEDEFFSSEEKQKNSETKESDGLAMNEPYKMEVAASQESVDPLAFVFGTSPQTESQQSQQPPQQNQTGLEIEINIGRRNQ
jgi:hypothetical protein